jgi:glutathione S-transferase
MITVFGAPPTRALRVLWMLEEMNLAYEVRRVEFAKRFEDAEFMAVNPAGSVPAIRDGDATLNESCAIIEYLGAKYGPTPLTPAASEPHYPAYISMLHFGEASLGAPLNILVASRFFAPEEHKKNWGAEFSIELFVRRSAVLRERLKKGPYIAGDAFTAADISCVYAIGLSKYFAFEDRVDMALRDYAARVSERPAYVRAMSKAQPL